MQTEHTDQEVKSKYLSEPWDPTGTLLIEAESLNNPPSEQDGEPGPHRKHMLLAL